MLHLLCSNCFFAAKKCLKILNKSIGRIIDIDYNRIFGEYGVEFENILDYKNYDLPLHSNEIRSFSKNKKQLELELNAETYNL